jgi:hypothetical protein
MNVTRGMRRAALMLLGLATGLMLAVVAAHIVTPHSSPEPVPAADGAKGGVVIQHNIGVFM